ncbi:ABC-type transport auxiliary lipoprotein family protein [Lacimicrobium sp. SS2-24]|uniref:PqiC family protein n=1 Tax=Lacimicrobium sp. SS2-24 TaxID=2005569 RepID=UPI000B4A707A|nr:ABC-type transport auxiliary lipoprotein family protein [Lacimicrobium sp. SS2-24]
MKIRLILLSVVMLSACSASPPAIEYYLLDTPSSAVSKGQSNVPAVVLESLQMPDYLLQNGLVMSKGTNQLHISSQHYWAQSMKTAVQSVLLKELNGADSNLRLLAGAEVTAQHSRYQLHIDLIHLLIVQQHGIRLQARYWLTGQEKNKILHQGTSDIDIALTADGYEHAVEKMREAVVKFCQQLNQELGPAVLVH